MGARTWMSWPLVMLGIDPGDTTAATVAAVAHRGDGTVVVVISSANDVTGTGTLTGDQFNEIVAGFKREPLALVPPRAPGRYETLPPRPPPAAPVEPPTAIRVPRRLLHRRSHCG